MEKNKRYIIEWQEIFPIDDKGDLIESLDENITDYVIELKYYYDNQSNIDLWVYENKDIVEIIGDSQFFKFKDDILPGYVWLVNNKIYPQGEVPGDSLYYGKDIELGNFSSEEFDKLDDAIEEYKKILLRYGYKNFKSLPQKLKLNR